MVRGTTQEFEIRFNNDLDVTSIVSYCLAFGRTERKSTLDVYEKRNAGINEGDTATSIKFNRARFSVVDGVTPQRIMMNVKLTEEESLNLTVGDMYVQLKICLSTGDVISSDQRTIEVEDSLCNKEMDDHAN